MSIYLGIDPGAGGGLVALRHRVGTCEVLRVTPMPETEKDVWEWFCDWPASGTVFATIEKVGGFHRGGESRQPGSAMFNFGQGYGGLRMALIAAGIPFEEEPPQRWQKGLHLALAKGLSYKDRKNTLKAHAQRLFPTVKVTHAIADALLVAEYGRRKALGLL